MVGSIACIMAWISYIHQVQGQKFGTKYQVYLE